MHGGFEMTHGSLEASASHLRVHGEEYSAALERLRQRGGGAASWGDDGLMSYLASAYTQATATALDAYTLVGDVIGSTGNAMSTASRRVSLVEDDTTRGVAGLTEGQGGTWA
ncbi:hypothetical protein [Sphaerisporangium sp. TRM90804]|uniref:hypothetical protein n=1 Tax=Sphaerisporangium sp. TRM90804 TaxID=3031113 RepID=UPI00244D2633|nr:hypothetical protein [Sphaerisporangium sp. TRM90804]MDH2427929.1 hypothetical protein [Sphaerisporangium sp. TRM90804]